MAHVNFLTITYTILIVLFISFGLSRKLTFLFKTEYGNYFMWLYILTIVELSVLPVFGLYYQSIYHKKGKIGNTGRDGKRGSDGSDADCNKCKQMMIEL